MRVCLRRRFPPLGLHKGILNSDVRAVETKNLKKVSDPKSKIKKKKEGQYEEKITQVCAEEFDLNKEEVLTRLKKAVDDRMLKTVNKNNKKSYRIVQPSWHSDVVTTLSQRRC